MKCFRNPYATTVLSLLGLIFSFRSFGQAPGNDECSSATALTSSTSCVNTAGTNVNATWNPSSLPVVGCGASDKYDVWYTFVAQSTSQTITLSSAPANIRVQLLSGSCGSFTSLACGNSVLAYTGLTIGNTYYIRVYTQSNSSTGSFNICVTHSPPANDNCSGATSLTSNPTCINTAGTLNDATASGGALGCFAAGTYYDVWYSFVAAATTETVTISSLGANITNPQIQIYGGSCASLTNLSACGTTSVTQSGLTIGTTYYVRVANLASNPSGAGTVANFDICVTHTAPANDDCAGAISLTSNSSCSNTAGTLVGASYSTISSIGCGVADRNDVWYSFVAVGANTTITLSSAPANPRIQLFSGSCASLTSVACGTSSLAVTSLTPGTTYYVRIYTDPNTISASNTFNICVTHSAPLNDECASATSITSYTSCVNTTGTLNLATANGATAPGCFAAGTYYDVWYSFVAQATSHTVTLSNLGANIATPRIQIYTNACAALGTPVCGTTSITQTGLTVGTTYRVRVSNMGSDPSGSGTAASFDICVTHAGVVNDACEAATTLTSATSCVTTAGAVTAAVTYTASSISSHCSGAVTTPDVWYKFVAQSPNPTITGVASSNRERLQLFSGTCGTLTCLYETSTNNTTQTINAACLTIGETYYIRVYSSTGVNFTFNICVTDPVASAAPSNDNCSGATVLTPGTSCVNTAGTLAGATASSPSVSSSCSTPGADVWYQFTATSAFPTITLSSVGSNICISYIQLFSGSCGSFTELSCASGTSLTAPGTGVTVGNTYYVRIYSPSTGNSGTGYTFNICITNPGTSSSATVDYSKSYINVTKLTTGGTVEPGDILEIRATFVVRSGTVDSVAFYDTLQNNGGFTLVSSSICTQTNEGKVYNSFTDARDTDAGGYFVSGSDTIIQINVGSGSSGGARGRVQNSSRPSFFNSTCIIMATYRVQVYAGYDTKINWGGGALTYKDGSNMKMINFKNDSLVVYASPGLCSSSLSAFNQVGIETNGTFGTPGSTPLARNRGTSTAVPSYTYRLFATGSGPNDYYYGIANNTSATYTTVNTWPKSGSVAQRVFNLWDITGDHTGATNTAKGNLPCDTTQPVSATNPCGYMLVVNAAYKTDTAVRSSITGLCPNTFYEMSAWVKNICYKCGCDSLGRGSSSAGYIPFATNDSSGVPPNLAFQIDGQDYYTTGNIYYTGTGAGITPQGSDSTNTWVKRGFVYKTGPSQTSFELLIRNNAPGGGGNDWAIDDIVVATCSPEVTVTPGPNPFICDSNTVDMGAIIASYYDNYVYYSWEKSTDNGATWSSTGVTGGPETPTWNGSAWEYSVTYPTFVAYGADSASQYRIVIASTASNLSNSSCRFSGGATITLTVDPCSALLHTDNFMSFRGKNDNNIAMLFWTTGQETEPFKYEVQKSNDGSRFYPIGEVSGNNDISAESNNYTFADPELLSDLTWYRIKMINTAQNTYKYSKVIQLIDKKAGLKIESLINPFRSEIKFDLISGLDGLVNVQLLDQYQHALKNANFNLVKGTNKITISNTDNLPAGFYILKVTSDTNTINKKIIKRN
jgi:trimeric autotransporter adhesin